MNGRKRAKSLVMDQAPGTHCLRAIVSALLFFACPLLACTPTSLTHQDQGQLLFQAAHDLACEPEAIETRRIAGGYYGARGCGQEATYNCRRDNSNQLNCEQTDDLEKP